MAKPKISRPILYTAVLGVAGYAVFLLTQPDAPTATKKTTRTTASTAAKSASNGILPEDLKAHFGHLPGPKRDAFLPHVVSTRALAGVQKSAAGSMAATGNWTLTGITDIDGARTALLESGASGTSVFLKVGDVWMGHRVTQVGDTGITLVNGQGQQMMLSFPTPEDLAKQKGVGQPQTPPLPGMTVTAGAPGLMPFPVPNLPGGQPGQAAQAGQPAQVDPTGRAVQPDQSGQTALPAQQDQTGGGGGRRRRNRF